MSGTQALKILITGGARGIGRGLFRHFLRAGHSVYVLDSNTAELEHVKKTAETWKSASSQAVWKASLCDLRDRANIKAAVEDVRITFDGKLDVLINNAMATEGVGAGRPMEDDSDEIMDDWDTKIAVGLTAPYLLGRLCVPLLKTGSSAPGSPGTIINISSTRAYQAEDNHEAYSAAKAGILGLTQSMSVSLGHRHKIRVNAVLPGWIHVMNERAEADGSSAGWEEGLTKEDADWHPAGRVGKVDDIAKAVEYLIGSGFVTGQEVVVDGGVGRKMVYPEE
ncbi:3-oxoacyl-reductase [Karstenula rhodostoma CBS 690.94]|uniref:3-oxoacyl-reductase n=1 Tax=Karstenula rhodostoma CBS 690.94 TaxID=1392251 RepID=A0A9P4UGL4_9PLEO|nr:3-oxoacyl-reductase [Karstenula rhodostoma CBS 690.94]